jgi:hypothetical protein
VAFRLVLLCKFQVYALSCRARRLFSEALLINRASAMVVDIGCASDVVCDDHMSIPSKLHGSSI